MKKVSIYELAKWSDGSIFLGDENAFVSNVGIDSRNIEKNAVFFAIKGENYDGHDFIFDALTAGAEAVIASDFAVLEREIKKYRQSDKNASNIVQNSFINVILVEDTKKALGQIAQNYLRKLDIKIVAVTGSVGKTSVKDMIASVCSCKYYTAKTQGNFNNEIGLPLTILRMDEKTELAVLEMGMSHRGEIRELAEIAMPQIGVVTNVGVSHIENLGSREAICDEKLDIASFFSQDCVLVLNGDDELLRKKAEEKRCRKVFATTSGEQGAKADVIISHIESGGEIITFDVESESESATVRLSRAGRHNALNAGLALAVGKELGICLKDGALALANTKYQARRLEFRHSKTGITIIDDTYNASPDSMKAALSVLSEKNGKRKIAVLADMLEMGTQSELYHSQIGEYAAKLGLAMLFTYGNAAKYIAAAASKNDKNMEVFEFQDKQEMILQLEKIALPEDVILVKGSNSMGMNEVSDAIANL